MLVWKLPASTLRAHVGDPRRFSARQYDVNSGIGQVFNDYLKLVARQVEQNANPHLRALMDAHLVELLALTLQQHPDALQSQQSSIRDAHLARIEAYVQQHLSDPNLTPTQISKACRISLRYLHSLFRETGTPVSQWIRELRLQLAHESLRRATKPGYIATVAYDCGFNDHPKFTHAFRKKYGYTPSDLLRNVRADSSGPN
ncbi:transcriptional regulator, AraC family [Variovorax sp. WDL1]|nr:transcriptional regulator, AraC family [Variovorax sp. WDL1]